MQTGDITRLFREKGLKATPQRIAVYKFLAENHIHPDVETVYKNVVEDNPSFSKTTVYNCLKDLSDCGLLIPVKIDADKIRYDANISLINYLCNYRLSNVLSQSGNGALPENQTFRRINKNASIIQPAINYINDNYTSPVKLQTLASMCDVSASHCMPPGYAG